GAPAFELPQPPHDLPELRLEREQVVPPRLDLHEQAVEGGDVDAGRVVAALEALDQSRPGARKGGEHPPAARHVALEQDLDELWDELPEVRVKPVDVLRAHPLGQVALRAPEIAIHA